MRNNIYSPKKYLPFHAEDLVQSERSIIFITADRDCFDFLRHLKTDCVFCHKPAQFYDFSFCAFQEIWVLYSIETQYQHALSLAHAAQAAGAKRTYSIFARIATRWRVRHVE